MHLKIIIASLALVSLMALGYIILQKKTPEAVLNQPEKQVIQDQEEKQFEPENTTQPEKAPEIKIPVPEEAKSPLPAKKPAVPAPPAVMAPNQPSTCVQAGQESASQDLCCAGLRRVFVTAYYSPVKSCEELSEFAVRTGTVGYVCTNCGNKSCESWETRCNCPTDCIYP